MRASPGSNRPLNPEAASAAALFPVSTSAARFDDRTAPASSNTRIGAGTAPRTAEGSSAARLRPGAAPGRPALVLVVHGVALPLRVISN
jgi:hypothetical protein